MKDKGSFSQQQAYLLEPGSKCHAAQLIAGPGERAESAANESSLKTGVTAQKLPAKPARKVALIGAPTDVGASLPGARMGPSALRVAGLPSALEALGLEVLDKGDLSGPANPQKPPQKGYRHLKEVVTWNKAVFTETYQALCAGHLPVLLGGDHCLAIGSIAAVAKHCARKRKSLRVLWLDAHADFNTAELSPSGNLHGMPLSVLCGFGHGELTLLGGSAPALDISTIRQVGVRSVDAGERELLWQLGVEVFDMRYIDEHGMRSVMEAALKGLSPDTHLHVSFDVDFLDPEIAPGVGTGVKGGPTYREAALCMEMLHDTGALGSVDVVELNPALDVHNATACVAVELLQSLFGKNTLIRRPC